MSEARILFDDGMRRAGLWIGGMVLMGMLIGLSFGLGYRYGLERCRQILVIDGATELSR